MKVQIRQGVFETNSSSTHAISIIKKSNITEYPDEVRFDKGDFGWDFEIYFDTSDKASLYIQHISEVCSLLLLRLHSSISL